MNRREVLKNIALVLGGTIVGGEAFLHTGCNFSDKRVNDLFRQSDIELLNEIAETILPATTDSPGAKAANVGSFMAMIVADCYDKKQQPIFINGLAQLKSGAKQSGGKDFIKMNSNERIAFLTILDNEQYNYTSNKKASDPVHYFRMMKELTLLGYFKSEIGCTKAMRYVATPGKFISCMPYSKGDKAFAS